MGFLDWFLKPLHDPPVENADVREQALANMRAARARIGDDEIQKMAATLKNESLKAQAEKARKQIEATDKARVASHIKTMLDDK